MLQLGNGKKTKGRQCVENRRVEKKEARQVTFSKRKARIWKKVAELAVLCCASVVVVVFSEAGKAFAIGSPSADAVLGRSDYAPFPATADAEWEALFREVDKKGAEVRAEAKRMSALGAKVMPVKEQTRKEFWGEVDPDVLGEEELLVFVKALERLRGNVSHRIDNLLSNQ